MKVVSPVMKVLPRVMKVVVPVMKVVSRVMKVGSRAMDSPVAVAHLICSCVIVDVIALVIESVEPGSLDHVHDHGYDHVGRVRSSHGVMSPALPSLLTSSTFP